LPLDNGEFPVAQPKDAEGNLIIDDEDKTRYLEGRDGDHLQTPFQCETCHVRNLLGRDPQENLASDLRLIKLIRRANLDAFWTSEPKTVKSTLREGRRGARIASALGFGSSLYRPMGPFPLEDSFGMGPATVMLELSLNKGKYADTVQFGTVRKFRSAYANIHQASLEGQQSAVMTKETKKMTMSNCSTHGVFFEKFTYGMHKRMGDIVKPNRALSIEILVEIFNILEAEWGLRMPNEERWKLVMEACFYVIAFVCALRGEEVPKTDLGGIIEHLEESKRHKTPHVVIALLGRFKNEHGDDNYHLLPIANTTHSGLEPRKWIERGVQCCRTMGYTRGPMFKDLVTGARLKQSSFEPGFFRRLSQVQDSRPDLLGAGVDVEDQYGISRSFRRGATSRAADLALSDKIVNANNRWRSVDEAGSKKPSMTIRDHYTDIRLTINLQLQFSLAM
jgi:hypothetical protein